MDIVEVFSQFRKDVFPNETFEVKVKDVIAEFETFYPDIVKIIQKDNTFFDQERIVFGRNLSALENRDDVWKNIVSCMVACFFHGDIREKVGTLSSLIKNIWNSSGQKNDEISAVLNSEKSEGHFKEILDFVLNSRLAKIFTKLVETIDISDFDLKIENTDELIEMLKNPENPKIQATIQKVQAIIKDKVRKGEIDQNVIIREIETIKAKVIDLFGNVFKDALGGRRAEVPSAVMVGNSPEARRARMVARLQRKLRDKNSK
jgi:hypothetical protein